MANAYSDTTALSGLVKTAYDRYVEFALRSQPLIRSLADKRPVQQAMPGSSVVFSLYQDLAAVTGTLTETTDPDAVAISNTNTVSVTLYERGNSVLQTKKLGEFAFSDVDPAVANMVAFNLADSLDKVVNATLITGTNVLYGGTRSSTVTVTAADVITTFVPSPVRVRSMTSASTPMATSATSSVASLASSAVRTSWRLPVRTAQLMVRRPRRCTARSSLASRLSLRLSPSSRVLSSARSLTS